MDRLTEKQAQIKLQRQKVALCYPDLWSRMVSEWNSPGSDDRAWLMYSANYLFRTTGVRWALDPLTLRQRLPEAPEVDIVHDLKGLSFILLTHRHADHLDLKLVSALSAQPILWVVPEAIRAMVEQAGLPRQKIIPPMSFEPIEIHDLRITPFDGLHWESDSERVGALRGVPATGYLVEFNGKRWLFPGDTRTYRASRIPIFGVLDGAFVHLWLGRASALLGMPPLLKSFCRFCEGLQSPRLIITHLQDYGREANEFWDDGHFLQVKQWLRESAPDIKVESAELGGSILL
jgi:hypothetical protein